MTLITLIIVNAVLAAAACYGIVFLHAHGIRHDRRHAQAHQRSRQAFEPEWRDQLAA